MDSNSLRPHGPAGTASPGQAGRDNASLSPQNRRLQAASAVPANAGVRVAPTLNNRAYLKALRQAELRAWTAADAHRKTPAAASAMGKRLPSGESNAADGYLYGTLAFLSALALLRELASLVQASPGWSHFIQLVRQLLT